MLEIRPMERTFIVVLLSLLGSAKACDERNPLACNAYNHYKPLFTRCQDYKLEVFEEEPLGTRVHRVMAEDRDRGKAGKITYSVVSPNNSTNDLFAIDPETGWLTTKVVFNRDEPDHEELVHVTVKASDNGHPKKEDVCTMIVKVKDRNDNKPVFDKDTYQEFVAPETPIGTQILQLFARDADSGRNQEIIYDLTAASTPGDIAYFDWHWQTGVVTLKKNLDKPIGYVFELKAVARDLGYPPQSTEIDVTLEVKEVKYCDEQDKRMLVKMDQIQKDFFRY